MASVNKGVAAAAVAMSEGLSTAAAAVGAPDPLTPDLAPPPFRDNHEAAHDSTDGIHHASRPAKDSRDDAGVDLWTELGGGSLKHKPKYPEP